MAEARGEFSVRGHIVDIYPPHLENPLRFDLFGDEIESLRFFDVATQRSMREGPELERVTIFPVQIRALAERTARAGGRLASLVDWLPEDTLLVLDSPEKFEPALERLDAVTQRRYEEITTPERVRLQWASAAEGPQLAEAIDEMVSQIRTLGPLCWSGQWSSEDEVNRLAVEQIGKEHVEAMEALK